MQILPSRKFGIVRYYPRASVINTLDGQKIINLAFLVNKNEATRRGALTMRVFLLDGAAKARALTQYTGTGLSLVQKIEQGYRHKKAVIAFGKDRAYMSVVDLSQLISNEAATSTAVNPLENETFMNTYTTKPVGTALKSMERQVMLHNVVNQFESYDPAAARGAARLMAARSKDPASFLDSDAGHHGSPGFSYTGGVLSLETPAEALRGVSNSNALALRRNLRSLGIGKFTMVDRMRSVSDNVSPADLLRAKFLNRRAVTPTAGIAHRMIISPNGVVHARFFIDDKFLQRGFTKVLVQVLGANRKKLLQTFNVNLDFEGMIRASRCIPTENRVIDSRLGDPPRTASRRDVPPPSLRALILEPNLNRITATQRSPHATGMIIYYRVNFPNNEIVTNTGHRNIGVPNGWRVFYESSTSNLKSPAGILKHSVNNMYTVTYRAFAFSNGIQGQEFSSAVTVPNIRKDSNRNIAMTATGPRLRDRTSIITAISGVNQIAIRISNIPVNVSSVLIYRMEASRLTTATTGRGPGPDWLNDRERHIVGQVDAEDIGGASGTFVKGVDVTPGAINVIDTAVAPGFKYAYRAVFLSNGLRRLGRDFAVAESRSEADTSIIDEIYRVPAFTLPRPRVQAPSGYVSGTPLGTARVEFTPKISISQDLFENVFKHLKSSGISDELLTDARKNQQRFNNLFFIKVIRDDDTSGERVEFPPFQAFTKEPSEDDPDPNALLTRFVDDATTRGQRGISPPVAGRSYLYTFQLKMLSPLSAFDGIYIDEVQEETRVRYKRSISKFYRSLGLPRTTLPSSEALQRMERGTTSLEDSIIQLPVISEVASNISIPAAKFNVVNASASLLPDGRRLVTWESSIASTASIDHFVISLMYNGTHGEPVGVVSNHDTALTWQYEDGIIPSPIGIINYSIVAVTRDLVYGTPIITNPITVTSGVGNLGSFPPSIA